MRNVSAAGSPDEECFFCRKLAALEKLPDEEVVWQFPHSVALLGRWQYYCGYCILVSRRHATELNELEAVERRAYFDEMCLLARAIEVSFHPCKLNYEILGNQVPHLHWHLFPRFAVDSDRLLPVWLALARAEHDDRETQRLQNGPLDSVAIAQRLQQALGELLKSSQP